MRSITISEEFKVPGTDIILERGDKIKVVKEAAMWKTGVIQFSSSGYFFIGIFLPTPERADTVFRKFEFWEDKILSLLNTLRPKVNSDADVYTLTSGDLSKQVVSLYKSIRDLQKGIVVGREYLISKDGVLPMDVMEYVEGIQSELDKFGFSVLW